jgi:TrmH family RNA methyltransferase
MSPGPGIALAVVLVRPQEEGNIGAAARAMANMGLSELVLVEPAPALGRTARAFAVGAGEILDRIRRAPSLEAALAPYSGVVGTTAARGRTLSPPPLTPRQLAAHLAGRPEERWALLFGPEASGLDNEELARCGWVVSIPADAAQPTLNLAQAVLLVAYEIFLGRRPPPGESASDDDPSATADEIDRLFTGLAPFLAEIGFARDDTFAAVVRDLRRLAARAGLRRRELTILHGILRRARHALGRRGGQGPG